MLAWLGRRVVLVAWFAGVATFAGGALGGLLSGSLCRALTTDEGGVRSQDADAICRSSLGFGVACLATLLAIGLVVAVSRRRSPRVDSPVDGNETVAGGHHADVPPAHAGWLLVPAFALIAAGIVTWLAGAPALAFLAEYSPDSQGPGGIALLPAGFMLGATGTVLVAEAGLLLLLLARSPGFPRTCVLAAVAHLGLIVCSRALLDAIQSLSGPAGSEAPMLQDTEAVIMTATQGLIWSLAAHAASLPLLLLEQVRALFTPRVPAPRVSPRPSAGPAVPVAPRAVAAVPVQAAPFEAIADRHAMPGTKYVLRGLFVAWPLGGRVRIDDIDSAGTLTASLIPLSPWPIIHVWRETRTEHVRVVSIESRHLLGLGRTFDVLDGISREPLAVVKKPVGGEWLVYGPAGDLAAIVNQDRSGLGSALFVARIGEQPVASYSWSNLLRPSLEIDVSSDTGQRLDRRVAVAAGVLMFLVMSRG